MEDKLRLNTKLYGFDGIIGRRDYFYNIIIICSISLFFTIPYYIWALCNIQTILEEITNSIFYQAPNILKVLFFTGKTACYVLLISNIFRRLNDINGKSNIYLNVLCSVLFFFVNFGVLFPQFISFLSGLITFVIGLILIFKKGKITVKYPYDYRKEFNWGAFLGTWIWGLFNKSYKTLWQIPLTFTPWAIYYQLFCGLKGNEWAYKNKNWDDITEFNKTQETQTAVFAVIGLLLIPVIYLLIIGALVGTIVFTSLHETSTPEQTVNNGSKIEKIMNGVESVYFESHTITPDENKYYVTKSDWQFSSFSDKKEMLDLAASLAANERRREYNKQNPKGCKSFSKTTELNRTKIYSSETNELLGEFKIDESLIENGSFKDIVKAGLTAYKFYNPKT